MGQVRLSKDPGRLMGKHLFNWRFLLTFCIHSPFEISPGQPCLSLKGIGPSSDNDLNLGFSTFSYIYLRWTVEIISNLKGPKIQFIGRNLKNADLVPAIVDSADNNS